MNQKIKNTLVAFVVALTLSISAVSAQPAQSHTLSAATEAAITGGADADTETDSRCLKAIGVAGSLAVAGLSPCSLLCWGAGGVMTLGIIVWCT